MAGPEPSEIYAAAALCFHEKYLDDVVESGITKLIEDFFPEAEKEVKKNVIFPSGSKMTKQDLLTLFKDIDAIEDTVPDDEKGDVLVKLLPSLEGNEGKRVTEILKNMIVGISAAKAIKKWMKSEHGVGNPVADKVYLTGDKWPRMVEPLKVSAHGFDAYNSSDFIIRPVGMKNAYFGVSLKKKFSVAAADPTIINKAFDTLIKGKEFEDTRKELQKVRENYFGKLVKDAISQGHIHIKGGSSKSNKFLFNGHKPKDRTDNNMAKDRSFIDTKGSMQMKEILGPKDFDKNPKLPVEKLYGLAADDKLKYLKMLQDGKKITVTKSPWNYYGDKALNRSGLASRKNDTMRGWVNKQLGKPDALYKEFMGVMNDNKDLFVENLIQVALKKDLPDLMNYDRMGDMTFGFALVTGIGGVSGGKNLYTDKGKINLEKGKVLDIMDVRCGLAKMDNDAADYEFKIVGDEIDGNEDDGPAKVYFDLIKGTRTLLNMELRYKGGFTSQPQFFATISQDFIDIVKGKC
tara:strand:+ start:44 stop:1597 length:1554 start_codon:yes stop_codon:yes gene_type:complete